MKISVSLSEDDVAALDRYAEAAGIPTRSAAVHEAIRRLADADLDDAYEAAWDEWESSGESAAWEATAGDGLTSAPR